MAGRQTLYQLRQRRKKSVTIWDTAGTTTLKTTTNHLSSGVTLGDYTCGAFIVNVVANSTGAPTIELQGSWDNSTWYDYVTLHSDLTTTANASGVDISALPPYIRAKLTPYTTSVTGIDIDVLCELYV